LIAKLQEVDQLAREALQETAPEFLNAANILAQKVIFVPASALGTSPTRDADGHFKLRAAEAWEMLQNSAMIWKYCACKMLAQISG
jgi:hypothetical protein